MRWWTGESISPPFSFVGKLNEFAYAKTLTSPIYSDYRTTTTFYVKTYTQGYIVYKTAESPLCSMGWIFNLIQWFGKWSPKMKFNYPDGWGGFCSRLLLIPKEGQNYFAYIWIFEMLILWSLSTVMNEGLIFVWEDHMLVFSWQTVGKCSKLQMCFIKNFKVIHKRWLHFKEAQNTTSFQRQ